MTTTKPSPGEPALTAGPMHGISIFDFGSNHVWAGVHNGHPMFAAKDVCAILGLSNTGEAIASLDPDEKAILNHGALVMMGIVRPDDLDITRLAMITESGVYGLVFKSLKPEAKGFKKWITSVVLPSIRRSGGYQLDSQPPLTFPEALRARAQELEEQQALADKGQGIVLPGLDLNANDIACRPTPSPAPSLPTYALVTQPSPTPDRLSCMFNGIPVRVKLIDGEPWWVAKDVAVALGYVWNGTAAIRHIPEEWRGVKSVLTLRGDVQDMALFSEQGLYSFLGRSDKPAALPFQMWIASEVLSAIRKTGSYSLAPLNSCSVMDRRALLQQALEQEEDKILEQAKINTKNSTIDFLDGRRV